VRVLSVIPNRPSELSVRRHITAMLEELANLADEFEDPKLSDVAFRLRLIASETGADSATH
jgi:hypothetical protein